MDFDMATTAWRIATLLIPLMTIAVNSAPTWPARAQMWDGIGKDQLIATTHYWANQVCDLSMETWCPPREIETETPSVIEEETHNTPDTEINTVMTGAPEVAPTTNTTAVKTSGSILLIGDSLMNGMATGLRSEIPPQFKIIDRGRPSTGLCNRAYFDWPSAAEKATRETQPDWVIIHLGGNDGQDILHEGKWLRFGSDEWIREYQHRAVAMIQGIQRSAPNAMIAWVGLPAMRSGKYAEKSRKIEQVQRQAAQQGHVIYIDGKKAMGGEYAKTGPGPDGRVVILRADDGIHYSRAGGGLLGKALGETLGWPVKHP